MEKGMIIHHHQRKTGVQGWIEPYYVYTYIYTLYILDTLSVYNMIDKINVIEYNII